VTTACYHHLLHNTTTIEKGDDIVAITFFTVKPSEKVTTIAVTLFLNKAIKEGDGNCSHFLLLCNTTTEKGNGNNYHNLFVLYNTTTKKATTTIVITFFSKTPP